MVKKVSVLVLFCLNCLICIGFADVMVADDVQSEMVEVVVSDKVMEATGSSKGTKVRGEMIKPVESTDDKRKNGEDDEESTSSKSDVSDDVLDGSEDKTKNESEDDGHAQEDTPEDGISEEGDEQAEQEEKAEGENELTEESEDASEESDDLAPEEVETDTSDEVVDVEFIDVTAGDWFYNSVKNCSKHRVLKGYGDGYFKPYAPVSREMFVLALWQLDGRKDEGEGTTFDDLTNKWSRKAVVWAQNNSIINGISDTCFMPNKLMTLEEIIAVLYRYTAYKEISLMPMNFNVNSSPVYSNTYTYSKSAFNWAVTHRIISRDGSSFDPKTRVSRAKLAYILSRWQEIEINENKELEFEKIGFDKLIALKSVGQNNTELRDEVLSYIERSGYSRWRISYFSENMATGDQSYYAKDRVFVAASTYKLPLAMVYYDMANDGVISLDDTYIYMKGDLEYGGPTPKLFRYGSKIKIRTLLHNMILYSDNTAARILYRNLGGRHGFHKKANKYSDKVDYYRMSIHGNYINAQFSHDCLKYLYTHGEKYQTLLSDMSKAWGYFSSGRVHEKIAQKWGYYRGNQHNIGIVYADMPYTISIHTTKTESIKLINGINKIIYDYYQRKQ